MVGLPTSARVKDALGNIVAQSQINYDEGSYPVLNYGWAQDWQDPNTNIRGNATTTRSWLNTTNGWLESHAQYDNFGNMRKAWDARGNLSQVDYANVYQFAYPTQTISAVPDASGMYGATQSLVTNTTYDATTGLVTQATDANGTVMSIEYVNPYTGQLDAFNRPTRVTRASGTGAASQTLTTYDDVNRTITVERDLNNFDDKAIKSQSVYDGLGRTVESRQYENANAYIATKQIYDVMGRVSQSSNPYRAASESPVWTTLAYDALGRVVRVTSPDGAAVVTSYSGNSVSVSDQAGKRRKSETDALGRLVKVWEDPSGMNYLTSHAYDALDNLTSVTQGQQTRTFVYDSLKRLMRATSPESGVTSYAYDANGNLTSKQDARGITTSFIYDGLNRVQRKTYTDATPQVKYFYDTAGLPSGAPVFDRGQAAGQLVAVTYGNSSAGVYRGYDALGRVVRQIQRTDSINYLVDASYNRADILTQEVYPQLAGSNRRTVTYTPDAMGRLSSVATNATSYAGGASATINSYAAHGGVKQETYGNSLVHRQTFNTRLQPTEIKLGTTSNPASVMSLIYNFGTTDNNGNVRSITGAGGIGFTQSFGYDSLNRLTTSQETVNNQLAWTQTNAYDRYGNRWIDLGNGQRSLWISETNNRITNSSYDAAGNLLADGGNAYGFDAENHIKTVNGAQAYVYDGEGRRVRKLFGDNARYIYGVSGQQIAEINGTNNQLTRESIYGASGLLATITPNGQAQAGVEYATADHLGTPRVMTNAQGQVTTRRDMMPFGEEIYAGTGGRSAGQGYGTQSNVKERFTGKLRDETGLDYFLARYYSSTQGRFTSPDEFSGGYDDIFILGSGDEEKQALPYADVTEPQSLNKYQYCLNNPLRYVDPDGHLQENAEDRLKRAAQGGAIHAGRTLTHDGRLRREYVRRASPLKGASGSAARKVLKAEIRQRMTPLGKGLSEAADKSRQGQLAGKSAAQVGESASRTSPFWNKVGKASDGLGKVSLAAGVATTTYNIATAPEGQRGRVVAEEGGAWAGAISGGAFGAKVGATVGTFIEPGGGTAIGAAVGGIAGSVGGAIAGSDVAGRIYDWFTKKDD